MAGEIENQPENSSMDAPGANTSGKDKYHVFLSHNSAEKAAVEAVAEALQDKFKLNVFLDKWNLVPGETWQEDLEQALDESGCCAVFLGPAGIGGWHNEELRSALDERVGGGMRVVPVLLPGADLPGKESNLPRFLRRLTWVKFNAGVHEEDALHRLYCGIMGLPPGRPGDGEYEDVCPFRGLEVFHEEDEKFFFGREAVTQRLEEHIGRARFLAVLGPSGSGKSSVVRAGLLPRLRRTKTDSGPRYLPVVLAPGSAPLEELSFHLSKVAGARAGKNWNTQELLGRMSESPRGLHYIGRELAEGAGVQRIIIFIDQFEENFTFADAEQRRLLFGNLLTAVEEHAGAIDVVITMRSDFLGHVTAHSGLNAFVFENLFQVEPMRVEELREAIEFPAMAVGLRFEEGLIQRIISDAQGNAGELPLIEHALLELYHERDGRRLTLAGYEKIGGIEGALVRRADQELAALTEEQREVVRSMFVLRLTASAGDGLVATRRRALKEELLVVGEDKQQTEEVLARLVDGKLLTTYRDELRGVDVVEVAHEALIRRWPVLRSWLETHRRTARLISELGDAALAWEKNNRGDDYLFTGVRLAHFETLQGEIKGDLTTLEQEFIDAGLRKDLERMHEQRARRQETADARREADLERARADKASGRSKRLRWIAAATLVIGLGAAGGFGWNLYRANEASRKEQALTIWKQARSRILINPRLMFLHLKAEALSFVPRSERILRTSIYMDASTSLPEYRLAGFPVRRAKVMQVLATRDGKHILARGPRFMRLMQRDKPLAGGRGMAAVYPSHILGYGVMEEPDALLTWHEDGSVLLQTTEERFILLGPAERKAGKQDKLHPIVSAGINQARDRLFVLREDKVRIYSISMEAKKTPVVTALGDPVRVPVVSRVSFDSTYERVLAWNGRGRITRVNARKGEFISNAGGSDLGSTNIKSLALSDNRRVLEWRRRAARVFDTSVGTATAFDTDAQIIAAERGPGLFALHLVGDVLSLRSNRNPRSELRRLVLRGMRGATFGPRGRRMLVWDAEGNLTLWNLINGARTLLNVPNRGRVAGARFGGKGDWILTWGRDHSMHALNATTLEQSGPPLLHDAELKDAWISRRTGRITTFDGRHVRVWAPSSATADAWTAGHGRGNVRGMRWSRDGNKLASWTAGRVYIRDAAHPEHTLRTIAVKNVESVAFLNEDTRLLTWSSGGRAVLWDLRPEKPVRVEDVLRLGRKPRGAVAGLASGRALTWNGRTARLWDLDNGRQVRAYTLESPPGGARFDERGRFILLWTSERALMIDGQDGRMRGKTPEFKGRIVDAVHTGGFALLRFKSGAALHWAVDAHRMDSLGDGIASAGAVFFAFKDGRPRLLAVWGADHRLRFMVTTDGRITPHAPEHKGRILGAVAARDDKLLVTWSSDRSVRLWDIAQLTAAKTPADFHDGNIRISQIVPPRKHEFQVSRVLLNRGNNANFMVSRDEGNRVYLWDVSRGVRIGEPFLFRERIREIGLTPAGDRLTARGKTVVYVRDLPGDISFMDDAEEGFRVMVRALTGTRFNSVTREIKPLSPADWQLQESIYLRLARGHYEEYLKVKGRAPGRNVFQRFWPHEARSIRASVLPSTRKAGR